MSGTPTQLRAAVGRVSQTDTAWTARTGFGFVPRRGVGGDVRTAISTMMGIVNLGNTAPLELLNLLPDIVPEISLAIWNDSRLGCGEDSVRLKAMTALANGDSKEAPDGTAAITNLFANQPGEAGNFIEQLTQAVQQLLLTGKAECECVPGPRHTGLKEVWPVDSLTTEFFRKSDGTLILKQRQIGKGFVDMPMERYFWASLDKSPGNPYGRAALAPAVNAAIDLLSFVRDLTVAFHRIGMPRLDIGFDFEMWARIAKDILGLTDKVQIDDFVQEKFQETVTLFDKLKIDDSYFHGVNDKVGAVGSGDKWPNIDQIYNMLRQRLVMALKQMPGVMGVVAGSTETWAGVDWQIFAKGLETVVTLATGILLEAAALHLRLLGMPYTVEAEYQPIRANQRLTDATAERIEVGNAARKRDEGWWTQDEASQVITGSKAVEPEPIYRAEITQGQLKETVEE